MRAYAAAVLGAALALATGRADAQSGPAVAVATGDDDARARSLFYDGVEALERAEYDRALAQLRESYRLRAVPGVMLNIAQAYRAAGRPGEAIEAYREYLAVGAGTVSRERAEVVRNTIALLERETARVAVASEPAAARVTLDGRAAGATPLAAPLLVAPGRHEIELDLAGFVQVREQMQLGPGEQRAVRFRLAPRATAATLTVALARATPADDAQVALDGIDVGAPPVTRQLEPGGHRVEVTARGRAPFQTELVLAAHQTRSLVVRLRRPPTLLEQPWFLAGATALLVAAGAATVVAVVLARPGAATEPGPNSPTITVPLPGS